MPRSLAIVTTLAFALGLVACGGGGGGGGGGSSGVGSVQVGQPDCPTHPGSGQTQMSQGEYDDSGDVWCLTNDARAQNNLPPLTFMDPASQVAYDHSIYQQGEGDISHTGEGGTNPGQRLTNGGVQWSTWAENVAVGQSSPTSVVNAWLNSSGHYANIMRASVTHIGVGTRYGGGGPYAGPWWTQKFYAP